MREREPSWGQGVTAPIGLLEKPELSPQNVVFGSFTLSAPDHRRAAYLPRCLLPDHTKALLWLLFSGRLG